MPVESALRASPGATERDARGELEAASKGSGAGMAEAQRLLETVWGYKSFRSHQADIIRRAIAGEDVLALMPTGGGKSLCYQVPALVRRGTGVVVSPLIALMQDQVQALAEIGVKAAYLNSSLDWSEQRGVEDALLAGRLDLLYVAPERLLQERTLSLLERAGLALFAFDEAHCVSEWGHDFRPEYRQLSLLAERFPSVPRLALTATADARTRAEIVSVLALERGHRFVASFDRPNIRYTIAEGGNGAGRERLWRFLAREHAESAGIVYCQTRKGVEETAQWLAAKGRTALAYHAGLPPEERRSVLSRFLAEDGVVVVATIAFGMGIDKPDVRFVAHLNLPRSIEAYYQETGRAGRDGEPADAWMAYGLGDIVTQRQWIQQSEASEAHKTVQRQKLDQLIGLAEAVGCRRQLLLGYFDEPLREPCGNCDNCLTPPETLDGTVPAQKALSAVYRTGQRFGVGYLIDVLTGKDDERIARNRHDQLNVFGLGRDLSANDWRAVFRQLVAAGCLAPDGEGHGGLELTDLARPLLRGEAPFRVRKPTVETKSKGERERDRRKARAAPTAPGDAALLAALRSLRVALAIEARLPPYAIFHDRTLFELVERMPQSEAALHTITGLGERKIDRYGARLLEAIRPFAQEAAAETRPIAPLAAE
jgi:ATP-dependent DNA helicase RecQ